MAATAIGCGWMGTAHSVRFNSYQSEREMGRLPPLPSLANGMNDLRASWDMEDSSQGNDFPYVAGEKRTNEVDALWNRAETAEKDGNLSLDRELLNDYLKRTEIRRDLWFDPTARQARRNSAVDRLDALSSLDRGSNAASVGAYLSARRLHDANKPEADEIERALASIKPDRNLKDNVAYLQAAELYRQEEFENAANAFKALVRQYPRSEKREAALFMAALATMKTSVTYIAAAGNSDYEEEGAKSDTDQAWHDAFTTFQRLITENPRGRYSSEARGWIAYLLLRRHDRAGALAQYYRLLADKDENARIESTFSLTLVRSSATDDEMARVEAELADEPEAALAYAYHNIYNFAIDPGAAYPPYDNEPIKDSNGQVNYEAQRRRDEEREQEWKQSRAETERHELLRTLNFSKRLVAQYPKLAIGGAFALRVAQASEELGDHQNAVQFARRALSSRLDGDQRAEALWTFGVAEHRLRHFNEARESFVKLLRDYPQTRLLEGARRMLAMIAEDAGDIDGALEQYIALNYQADVGYFVDRLMTVEQLAGFIQGHPDSPRRNEFTYALGVRYLRANRWDEARKTLGQVLTNTAPVNPYSVPDRCNGEVTIDCNDPKEGDFDEKQNPIITPRLVMRDIQTANDLEILEQRAKEAEGDEAKAEALYQLASYQYQASSLLFYNPLASPGYWNLSLLATEARYRTANESQLLWTSTQEHERLARALDIYLDVVNRFPQTRAARDSLYTAAVCHERLSNYNPYWREIYQNGLHAGERLVTYRDVKAAYPNYQLPQGTYGWEPSTRTVYGGPGWQAPPKPPRRISKAARLALLLRRIAVRSEIFWREDGQRWLTEFVLVAVLLVTARVAARNRKRLRLRMARRRREQSRQVTTYPWLELFWIDKVEPSRREQVGKYLGEKRQEFIDLARDRRSRPVLVRNLVSHGLMFGLLISLIRTVW
jgi:TolA-binding protein